MKKNYKNTGTGFTPDNSEILITAENKDGKPVNQKIRPEFKNVYDAWEKGLKYDALKKSNDELVEALKECLIHVVKRCTDLGLDCTKYSTFINAKQALKNNEND